MTAIHWLDAAGGDFTDAGDWSGGVVPGAGDDAVIDAVGTYTVTLSAAQTVESLTLSYGGATFEMNSGASLTLGSNLTLKLGELDLNPGATITGGTLSTTHGKFIWNGGTLNGVTYDGPLNLRKHHLSVKIGPLGLVLRALTVRGPERLTFVAAALSISTVRKRLITLQ